MCRPNNAALLHFAFHPARHAGLAYRHDQKSLLHCRETSRSFRQDTSFFFILTAAATGSAVSCTVSCRSASCSAPQTKDSCSNRICTQVAVLPETAHRQVLYGFTPQVPDPKLTRDASQYLLGHPQTRYLDFTRGFGHLAVCA